MNKGYKQAFSDLQDAGGDAADLVLLSEINDLSDHVEETFVQVGAKFDEAVQEVKDNVPDLSKILATIKGKDGEDSTIPGPPGADAPLPTDEQIISLIKPLIPDPIPGPPGPPGRSMVAFRGAPGQDSKIPGPPGKDGSPDTAEQIRDKLELLQGDERQDKSSIRGITVSNLPPLNPKIGDLWIVA